MKHVLVFDVNETLLDLKALDVHFERIFGDASQRSLWFAQFIQLAMLTTIMNQYKPFGSIGMAALDMIAARRGVTLTDADRQAIGEGLSHLPPHPEARGALEKLRSAGFRLAALTNSTAKVAEAQLTNAGLRDLFEQALSADSVQKLKPSPEPYHMAAEQLGVIISGVRLIAAHAWDVAGAMNAGCAAAFVARPGEVLNPLHPTPDVVGKDLAQVADILTKV